MTESYIAPCFCLWTRSKDQKTECWKAEMRRMTRARQIKNNTEIGITREGAISFNHPLFSDFYRCLETLGTALVLHRLWNSLITTKLKCCSSKPNHCSTEMELGQYKWGIACVPCYWWLVFFPWVHGRYQCDSFKCKVLQVLFRHH